MKTSLRKAATPRRWAAPGNNERRLTVLHPRRRFLSLAAGAAAFPAAGHMAWGQTYPTRPITIVVPFAAGGGGDAVTRIIAERIRALLGQTVIIENVTGAGGTIGVGRVARSAGDGYTLVMGSWSTFVANGAVYALPFNLLNDFQPVALVAIQPIVIVARKSLPANDLKGLIAWLKANPGKAAAATTGVGSAQHVAAIYFQNKTDTRFAFVPYRGGAPAIQDLVGGQIDLMFATAADAVEQISAGSIKSYAVMDHSRLAAVPSIPNADEAGLPGVHFSQWGALFAPKRFGPAKLLRQSIDFLQHRRDLLPPRTVNMSCPCGVVVSHHASRSERKPGLSDGRPWAENSAESAGFLTL